MNAVEVPLRQCSGWDVLRKIARYCEATIRPKRRLLRKCESLALSEKSAISIVQFKEMRFLVGTTAGCIALLARLPDVQPDIEQGNASMAEEK